MIALTANATADDREQCLAQARTTTSPGPLGVEELLSLDRIGMPK